MWLDPGVKNTVKHLVLRNRWIRSDAERSGDFPQAALLPGFNDILSGVLDEKLAHRRPRKRRFERKGFFMLRERIASDAGRRRVRNQFLAKRHHIGVIGIRLVSF